MKICIAFIFLAFSFALKGQSTQLSGIVNRYATVIAFDSCAGKVQVSDTTGFRPGMKVLVLQMQGASIFTGNNGFYGSISGMNFAGRYEQAEVVGVAANSIFLKNKLVYGLLLSGNIQLVTFPEYEDVTVTDTLKALPWDGQRGGVIALRVNGTLTLNAPIVADGVGFRGAKAYLAPTNNCTWLIGETGYVYGLGNWRGGTKGEGISIGITGQELGRGPRSNGGGGGNDHNSGGGGGSNLNSGGDGGDNDEPSAFGCDGYFPGIGGIALPFSTARVFLGGGGGAGHVNNGTQSDGANGGGIIFLSAGTINGLNPKISANGLQAITADGDGAGGGGGGGTIWLDVTNPSPGLIARAQGGRGGSTDNAGNNRCFGPGGGGGGGRILTNLTGASPIVQGGQAGQVIASSNGCNGSTNGAEAGNNGQIQALPAIPTGTISNELPQIVLPFAVAPLCAGDSLVLAAAITGGATSVQWQVNTGGTWTDITGADSLWVQLPPVGTIADGTQYRIRLTVAGCYTGESPVAELDVFPLPIAQFSATQTSFSTYTFSNQSTNASGGLIWDFGDGQTSTDLNPTHIYTSEDSFDVALTVWNDCDTVTLIQTVVVLAPPLAGASTTSGTFLACKEVVVPFTNISTGNNATYEWQFVGGTPSTSTAFEPVVTYSTPGTYTAILTVTNASGSSTATVTFEVELIPTPTASFSYVIGTNGQVTFQSNISDATNVLWDFGDGGTATDPNPVYMYASDSTYQVVLTAWNGCDTVTVESEIALLTAPIAGFVALDTVVGCASTQQIFVANGYSPSTTLSWLFPGGNPSSSSMPQPLVSYTVGGTYNASLIVTNAAGADTLTRSFEVVLYGFPVADFAWNDLPDGPEVAFTNLSTGADDLIWDFGDGSATSTNANPLHKFPNGGGTFEVTLTVSGPCGISILTQTITVNADGVATGEPLNASGIRLYPNPSVGIVHADCSRVGERPLSIALIDVTGRQIRSYDDATQVTFDQIIPIELSDLPAGMYSVVLRFAKGTVVRPVIKL